MNAPSESAAEAWAELVTAALLGTDRRPVPDLPAGALADMVADGVHTDPADRMLAAVAAMAVARRSAFVPLPPAASLQPPEPDPRPIIPAVAAATWREIVAEWPVLEDEWTLAVVHGGWQLAADVLVATLARHRTDPVRLARVGRAAGPLAAWVAAHEPALAATGRRAVPPGAVEALPDLPVPPELAELLAVDAHTFVGALVPRVEVATPSLKPVFVNLLARCRPEVLADTAAALATQPFGLALALADLCRLRSRMLDELRPR
ncbi:MAG TPA: hypothetical protein VNQ73_00110 [Ilumatobacter sp.]|nr:hypothetical protein [Ilumatobacter sp.]